MAQQREPQRRKLQPRKQVRGHIQRTRISTPPKQGREDQLTANQQAWAHAFTVSLSGWCSRQKFYKDHLEADVKAEREAEVKGAAYDAERLAQRESDVQEDFERRASQLAEEEEEKAEAWSHKAWQMHNAGRGVRKLKHEYYGWNPEEEEYPRDLETERILARAKAKRMAERRAELLAAGENPDDAYNTDTDSDLDNSDSEGSAASRDIYISSESSRSLSSSLSSTNSASQSPPQSVPVVERAPAVDWREKARAGVIKKKLSVAKTWSSITWNQKSNIHERLLVLEDDGYDISELVDAKTGSDRITNIILARAAGDRSSGLQIGQSSSNPRPSSILQGESQILPLDRLDAALLGPYLGPTGENSPRGSSSVSPSGSPPVYLPRSAVLSGQRSAKQPEDDTQPFSFDEPYYAQPSRPRKRKRNDHDDAEIENELSLSAPVQKKRKVQWITRDDLTAQALQIIKRTVLVDVFRSAREVGRKSLPLSRIMFTAETLLADAGAQRPQRSSMSYSYPKTSRCKSIKSVSTTDDGSPASSMDEPEDSRNSSASRSYDISKCAIKNIVAELRHLTDIGEGETMIHIYDPDYDEDLSYTPGKSEQRIRRNVRMMQRQASRITVTVDTEGQTIFQGDAIILAKLLKALRTRELLHYAGWEWDGLCLQRSSEPAWYLSPQTQDSFVDVERRLEHRPRMGGVEIVVGVVVNGQTNSNRRTDNNG